MTINDIYEMRKTLSRGDPKFPRLAEFPQKIDGKFHFPSIMKFIDIEFSDEPIEMKIAAHDLLWLLLCNDEGSAIFD